MDQADIKLLTDETIPEAIRIALAERLASADSDAAQRGLEERRIEAERHKARWNTPLVAALAGLITLSATFVFDRLTGRDETQNAITIEQVRQELEASEARLRQELEVDTSTAMARLEAEAKEREFQFEIVRSELQKEGKANADRAAVLLFLARAGVLNALNTDELRAMAEEQQNNPDAQIIPQLSPSTPPGTLPDTVQPFSPAKSDTAETLAFDQTYQLVSDDLDAQQVCNAVRMSGTLFITMSHCVSDPQLDAGMLGFELRKPRGSIASAANAGAELAIDDAERAAPGAAREGIVLMRAGTGQPGGSAETARFPVRAPVVGEAVFLVGYVPPMIDFADRGLRGLVIVPVSQAGRAAIHPDCRVLSSDARGIQTDCISSIGMSGAPIVARSDGALLTMAAWGEGTIGTTAGPPLHLIEELRRAE